MDAFTWLGIGLAGVAAILSALSIAFILFLVVIQAGCKVLSKRIKEPLTNS
jgi:hypothetical protein